MQEGSTETTRGHGSQLESYCPSASDETQEQPNATVQGEEVGKAKETATDNQRRKFLLSSLQPPAKSDDLIQGYPYSHRMCKKGMGTPRVVPKKKGLEKIQIWPRIELADTGMLFQ